jgi:prepilin signal peptidase PulO-like enzyme (type II secretory pathway)
MIFVRFMFGAIIGSFLDVVAQRYDPDRFLFSHRAIGGRSKCVSCGVTLRWFELIPILSFIIQGGKCRSCGTRIAREHLIAEIVSGAIFAFLPTMVRANAAIWYSPEHVLIAQALWISAFLFLLLIALVDIRLHLIPDEANVAIGIIGIVLMILGAKSFGPGAGSFLGGYAFLFGMRENVFINHLAGFAVGALLFGFLVAFTRGRGMGMGDVKLGAVLGILLGWPDAMISFALAFIIGSIFGIVYILRRNGGLKSVLPFGPFLALGALTVCFFGEALARWYFSFIRL